MRVPSLKIEQKKAQVCLIFVCEGGCLTLVVPPEIYTIRHEMFIPLCVPFQKGINRVVPIIESSANCIGI